MILVYTWLLFFCILIVHTCTHVCLFFHCLVFVTMQLRCTSSRKENLYEQSLGVLYGFRVKHSTLVRTNHGTCKSWIAQNTINHGRHDSSYQWYAAALVGTRKKSQRSGIYNIYIGNKLNVPGKCVRPMTHNVATGDGSFRRPPLAE